MTKKPLHFVQERLLKQCSVPICLTSTISPLGQGRIIWKALMKILTLKSNIWMWWRTSVIQTNARNKGLMKKKGFTRKFPESSHIPVSGGAESYDFNYLTSEVLDKHIWDLFCKSHFQFHQHLPPLSILTLPERRMPTENEQELNTRR